MQNPYHSSTTALYDSTERLHRAADQYDFYNGSLNKVPLDDTQDWDGYLKSHSNRDSGLVGFFPVLVAFNILQFKYCHLVDF